jgi:hypothetical protein
MQQRIRPAQRFERPLKLGLSGISGSGKTYSSLLLAHGLVGDWSKICLIDTENRSADLYANLGKYSVLPLEDFSPQGYIGAINEVEACGFKVCIVDSLSHEWINALELVDKVASTSGSKNSFNAWGKVTPIHDAFVQTWLKSPMHIIATMRQKDDYVIEQNDKGKAAPRKVGLKSIQRDGLGFEFDLWFMIHDNHLCTVEKDRTQLFDSKPPFIISEKTGKDLLEWSKETFERPIEATEQKPNMPKPSKPVIVDDMTPYTATPMQKRVFASWAKEAGVTDKTALNEISQACLEVPMSQLMERIDAYVKNPLG